jgi:hypothetical protein
MRFLVWTVLAVAILRAQPADAVGPSAEVKVPPGAGTQLSLKLDTAPVRDDRIIVQISTKVLTVVLLTPDGQQVTEATATSLGFQWEGTDLQPPIGSTDAGRAIAIMFGKARPAGVYRLQFSGNSTLQAATARAEFVSDRLEYLSMMQQIKGFKVIGPTQLVPGQAGLDIMLDRDEKAALFDLVTKESAAKITLTLPNGQTIDQSIGKQGPISWNTAVSAREMDPPGAMMGIGGFLLREDGTHNVVMFMNASAGRYQVKAIGTATELTAAFIPLGRPLEDATDAIAKPPQPPAGQIRLQPYGLPYNCKVGDNLPILVGLLGDPLTDLRFEVRMEYRQILARNPLKFSEPVVETIASAFNKDAEGRYAATVVPRHPGILRVGVRVSGRRANGQPFSDETLLTDVTVAPVVARLRSLTESAIDADGNKTLDRLEITAKLDVVVPGPYEMRLMVQGRDYIGTSTEAKATLAVGEQTLTATISAETIRKDMKDGPWTVKSVQIYRPEGNTFGEFVATDDVTLATKAYRLDQWDRGAAFTERTVTTRGIRPAPSGRFRYVEVLWPVTTPGGGCSWFGSLGPEGGGESDNLHGQGTLPAGQTAISFVFDASAVASQPKRDWTFSPLLDCESAKVQDEGPLIMKFSLDPVEFEPHTDPFRLVAQEMLRLPPEGFGAAQVTAVGKKLEDVTFTAKSPIPGLTVQMINTGQKGVVASVLIDVQLSAAVKPGRYFVPVEANSHGQIASTEFVVDVAN